ncbi:MAG: pyruvate kinase [Chromatiales bacterium]
MGIVTKIALLKQRRTKIVATLGPASSDSGVIRRIIEAGANVIRLNMSHGDHDSHARRYRAVRGIAVERDEPIAIFADLCGPKMRVGKFFDGQITLTEGRHVTATTREVLGEPGLIPSLYPKLAHDVKPGDRILLSDGDLELRVDTVEDTEVSCTVVHGGLLQDHKGMNLPGVDISTPALTDKDREDARFALDLGIDFLALSFVREPQDVQELRDLIRASGHDAGIIAKIEKPEALEKASVILDLADAIMVARGDLGVELSPEQVPIAQNQLIARARSKNRPVIVATQMLESMIERTRPTRAEVTDISQAVSAGADAVMLSGETAAGKHPVEAVEMMSRIVRQTEAYHFWQHRPAWTTDVAARHDGPMLFGDAIAEAAAHLAFDLSARAVVVISQSGMSAVTISSRRPSAPVVAVTSTAKVARRMNLMWGVIPIVTADVGATNPNQIVRRIARELDLADPGEYVLLVRGFHSDPALNTPSITLLAV